MRVSSIAGSILLWLGVTTLQTAEFITAPQQFLQETATRFTPAQGLPGDRVQLIDLMPGGSPLVFAGGRWWTLKDGRFESVAAMTPHSTNEFTYAQNDGSVANAPVPWREVRQFIRGQHGVWIVAGADIFTLSNGQALSLDWPRTHRVGQIAVATDGTVAAAGSDGLYRRVGKAWIPLNIRDDKGRAWAVQEVLGVAYDAQDRLWFAVKAGVGCQIGGNWRFYEGKDGLPWNDFTGLAAGPGETVWFGTKLGAIYFDGRNWHYRQGPLWLPNDEVRHMAVDEQGKAWLATAGGLGCIERKLMTLAQKATFYEEEIARYIKRTPFGYVAEAMLRKSGDKTSSNPQDSDNDGLWTAMYGAGECFAYAATRDMQARERAKQAFEALRFLQKVTQNGPHAPPKGYVARTIRPTDHPDPNLGRLEHDRAARQRDSLWKVYEPRWPKSADGQWYWKSDTSSDELDGHFFFYALYYDFCADTDAEKGRLREVVRDLMDHLLEHRFALIDHDGQPTRWAIYGPDHLNHDPRWWPERGLNSLSILSYLAAAEKVTGDPKYATASRELIEHYGYAQNAMYPKVQHGPGSGNQSDDEMAFMCYYNLLCCSTDEALKAQIRYSFFRYWANEVPEMNPFFNFAYAAHNLGATTSNPFGRYSIKPWSGWHEDAMATLYGFPLDRRNWPHRNSHRLDIVLLGLQQSGDLYEARRGGRGYRVNGKVLPVENRHFNHWNTDPWELDYGGQGNELAAGTVFLLPYYLGLYHGFIEKP